MKSLNVFIYLKLINENILEIGKFKSNNKKRAIKAIITRIKCFLSRFNDF